MQSNYDHHRKAGNEGDMPKHPSLIAAIDTFLDQHLTDDVHYVDAFAGHPWHPLLLRANYEWANGIDALRARTASNKHVESWLNWYLQRPDLIGGHYPGSAVIAVDVFRSRQRPFHFDLCDKADEPIDSLKEWLGSDGLRCGESAEVHRADSQGEWTQMFRNAVNDADFLLLDPPGLRTNKAPSFPPWSLLKRVLRDRKDKATLLWLPTAGFPDHWTKWDSGKHKKEVAEAVKIGFDATYVRWGIEPGQGCVLIHNIAKNEIRSAVDAVVDLTDWRDRVRERIVSNPNKEYANACKSVVIHAP